SLFLDYKGTRLLSHTSLFSLQDLTVDLLRKHRVYLLLKIQSMLLVIVTTLVCAQSVLYQTIRDHIGLTHLHRITDGKIHRMQQFQRCKHPITVLPSLKEQHLATSPDKDRRLFHDMLLLMLPGQYYTRTDFLRLELQLDHSSILHREHLVNLKQDRY